ncbi:MAG: type II toxin-antitoxin system RelE family toxin [Candidatus Asgardarchaeia archaeon]
MFTLIFSKKASNFIRTLDKGYREKLKEIFEIIQVSPFSYPYKKIKGEENLYRIHVGRFRILYRVNQDEKKIEVLKIDKRSSVYKNI